MIVDERLVTYINSLDAGNTAMLDQIEREATADYVPIIRKEMQSFLKFLLAMKKPARILEVGTGGIFRHPYGGVRSCAVSDYNDREL